MPRTITYDPATEAVVLIDQTRLPAEEVWLSCQRWEDIAHAIRSMQIRGAPAIGVAGAYGLALAPRAFQGEDAEAFRSFLHDVAAQLRGTRPTAVNLGWALDRVVAAAELALDREGVEGARRALLDEARRMEEEDVAINRRLGMLGMELIPEGSNVLTHCNTGALATVDYGTALSAIRTAHEHGRSLHIYVDETRPFLQGARLTAWELQKLGVPLTLITDSMAGHFMSRGKVDLVMLGADRVAANGDVANKIGTYTLAVLAREHDIPFYVVAPTSTIDLAIGSGAEIPIEERSPREVVEFQGRAIAPEGVTAAHPAFDVTPARLITAIVTEQGIVRPPYERTLREAVEAAHTRATA